MWVRETLLRIFKGPHNQEVSWDVNKEVKQEAAFFD